ncbi:hypothetical protein ACFWY5_53525 [Nonomuraea sp. NPDC059007]|uniref:hypothetical protein n=1 Tax=Nonomuraea sp. NPDC059007 TaxID=3346692 RepID=UPI00368A9967
MAWKLIPGASTTLPVAMAYARDGELLVFHVGTDQIVYLNRRPADTWLGWQKFPQPAQTKYAVAAANGPGGNVIVFHTGLDGKLYQSGQDGADGWTPWELLDGGTGNTPRPSRWLPTGAAWLGATSAAARTSTPTRSPS